MRKKSPPSIGAKRQERFAREMTEMRESGDWDCAEPAHFVALFVWMHTRVYEVEPIELTKGTEYALAARFAKTMLVTHFKSNVDATMEFMRWAWRRESEREQWRRDNGKDGGRLTARFFFSGTLVTDYRIAMARQRK